VNLTFNVCWIEDQATDAFVESVEEAVRANGFAPKIERIATQEEIAEFAQRQEQFYDYELILLDLQLGATKGDEVAKSVRRHFRSTPLLFYSGADEVDLRKLMYDAGIEGVYCVHREELTNRVRELVGELSPALNRLNSMRGLAAQTVAVCDERFREIIMHAAQDAGQRDEIFQSLRDGLIKSAQEREQELNGQTSLDGLMQLYIPTAALFREALRIARIAGENDDDILDLHRAVKKNFYPKLTARRNTLSHVIEERTRTGFVVRTADGTALTRDDFISYRAEFAIVLRDVTNLHSRLVPQ
jgi:DNA-binding response OmpR family regulator